MPWFKVDDQLCFSAKTAKATNRAMGLWVRAGSWSMQQLTDGHIPDQMIPALGGNKRDAQTLVQAGFWHPAEGGYQFHQWAEWQPTKAALVAERDATRERVRAFRQRKHTGNVTPIHGAM